MPRPASACARPAWKSVRARAEDGRRHGLPADGDLRLVEVQAALAVHEEGERAVLHGVVAAAGLVAVRQAARDGEHPVVGGPHRVDEPVPRRVLVVVQVALCADAVGAGVEGVDEHGGDGGGAGDLNARLAELGRHGGHAPRLRGVAGGRGRRQLAVAGAGLRLRARLPERGHAGAERPVHVREVVAELRREQLRRAFGIGEGHAPDRGHRATPERGLRASGRIASDIAPARGHLHDSSGAIRGVKVGGQPVRTRSLNRRMPFDRLRANGIRRRAQGLLPQELLDALAHQHLADVEVAAAVHPDAVGGR